jgi:hypothetical protein
VPSYSSGSGGTAIPTELTGASLAQRRRGWSAPQRAVFAARRAQGKAVVTDPTVKTIAEEAGVSVASIYAAPGLSESEQNAVWRGIRPLKSAMTKAKPTQLDLPLGQGSQAPTEITDAKLVARIKSVGVERAFAAIEAAGF